MRVWTIGHSNGVPAAFLSALLRHGVRRVVDVRRFPRSQAVPWASAERLPRTLAAVDADYMHVAELGGMRAPRRESTENDRWRSESFRGYADHMQTPEFRRGLERLLAYAAQRPTAILCAEAVPWRCHRSLIADALAARGVGVLHIEGGQARPHEVRAWARVVDGRVTYPNGPGHQSALDSFGAPDAGGAAWRSGDALGASE